MKRSIVWSVICVITCVLYSSCTSNLSITKRHYRNGYYVDHDNGNRSTAVSKEKASPITSSTNSFSEKAGSEQSGVNGLIDQGPKADRKIMSEENKRVTNKNITAGETGHKINMIETPFTKIKNHQNGSNASGDTSDDSALSLFWIIILVLLILWAVGFLTGGFGLGGLIHVLLVIALVLLILWLLRII